MRRLLSSALFAAIAACGGSTDSGAASPGADGGTTGEGGNVDDAGMSAAGTPLARGLKISVAVFQATKAVVVKDGVLQAAPNAPVIAARPGVVRVYVTPDSSWRVHDVVAELHVNAGGVDLPVRNKTLTVSVPSSDDRPNSTFDFPFSADEMPPGTTFSIAIRDPGAPAHADDASGAWFPSDGSKADFAAQDSQMLNIVFVPLKYDADGSGRVADSNASQMSLYQETLYRLYPVSKVTLSVHAPLPWSQSVDPDGTGWDSLLQALIDLRQQEAPPVNTYYVAALEPAATFESYCSVGNCVLGMAPRSLGPGDVYDRTAAVLGFTGRHGPDILPQELGHAFGRMHAPCGGAPQVDTSYPYPQAKIGVWGYDVLTQRFLDPAQPPWRDYMSYCPMTWTSDYTYNAIAKRLHFVNTSAAQNRVPPTGPTKWQWVTVKADGSLVPGRVMTLSIPPQGTSRAVTFHAADGHVVARDTAHYYAYGGQPGGFIFVPVAPKGAEQMRVDGLGHAKTTALATP